MINGDLNEFIDSLNYGCEMYFVFQNTKYFIQGWYKDQIAYLVLDNQDIPFEGYIWEYKAKTMKECAIAFLKTKLFDNKTFYEVEREITWVDC